MTAAIANRNGSGTHPGGLDFSHVACGESEIDRMFDQDGGFQDLGHYVAQPRRLKRSSRQTNLTRSSIDPGATET